MLRMPRTTTTAWKAKSDTMRRKRASRPRGCHHEISFPTAQGLGPLAEAGLNPIVATMKLVTSLLCLLGLSLGVHAAAPDEFPAITHQELTAAMKPIEDKFASAKQAADQALQPVTALQQEIQKLKEVKL